MNGKIKTKTDKGFGFIFREGEEKDLFFHSNDLEGVTFDELKEGEKVTFDKVVKELMIYGADPNIINNIYMTPIDLAHNLGYVHLVRIMKK